MPGLGNTHTHTHTHTHILPPSPPFPPGHGTTAQLQMLVYRAHAEGGCGFTSHKIGPGQHGWYRSEHLGDSSPSCGPVAGDQMALRLLPDDLLDRTHTQTDSKRTLALWTYLRGTVRRTLTYTSTHSLCTHAHQARKASLPHAHQVVHAPRVFIFPSLYAATSLSVHHDQDDRTEPFDRPSLDGDLGWPVH